MLPSEKRLRKGCWVPLSRYMRGQQSKTQLGSKVELLGGDREEVLTQEQQGEGTYSRKRRVILFLLTR